MAHCRHARVDEDIYGFLQREAYTYAKDKSKVSIAVKMLATCRKLIAVAASMETTMPDALVQTSSLKRSIEQYQNSSGSILAMHSALYGALSEHGHHPMASGRHMFADCQKDDVSQWLAVFRLYGGGDGYFGWLQGLDFRGCDLSGSDLSDADLTESDLTGTLLIEARLTRADLSKANLAGSDLSGADLRSATLN